MTQEQQDYVNNNTNEVANLAYAVANGMMSVEDTGLSEDELGGLVTYKGKGSDKNMIPVFADRATNGDAMLELPKETETLEVITTNKTGKKK